MNPWDDFLNAPYFALYKEGTEFYLHDIPSDTPFVCTETGNRYLSRENGFAVPPTSPLAEDAFFNVDPAPGFEGPIQLIGTERVVIDDREVP